MRDCPTCLGDGTYRKPTGVLAHCSRCPRVYGPTGWIALPWAGELLLADDVRVEMRHCSCERGVVAVAKSLDGRSLIDEACPSCEGAGEIDEPYTDAEMLREDEDYWAEMKADEMRDEGHHG